MLGGLNCSKTAFKERLHCNLCTKKCRIGEKVVRVGGWSRPQLGRNSVGTIFGRGRAAETQAGEENTQMLPYVEYVLGTVLHGGGGW